MIPYICPKCETPMASPDSMLEMRVLRIRHTKGIEPRRAAGCSQSQIADWERGRSEPGMASLRVLARALGCRMEELVATD